MDPRKHGKIQIGNATKAVRAAKGIKSRQVQKNYELSKKTAMISHSTIKLEKLQVRKNHLSILQLFIRIF